jgi:hypothetical protein
MTTGATGQLGLALPVQGELSGTWGDTVNNGITQYTNIAIAATLTLTNDGAVTLANTTGDASASNITSTLTGAGTVTAQFAIVRVTGTLTVAKVVTAPSYSKTYTVVNAATGGIVTFKAAGQTGVSIAVGESAFVYFNGTDYVKVSGTSAVSSFTAGTTGFTPSTATTGAITLAGTLATTNGGTGLTSFTSGGVVYASSSSALATGSALTFDGTNLGLGVTPSASWLGKAFEINGVGNAIWSPNAINDIRVVSNTKYNAGVQYAANGYANGYYCGGTDGTHTWYNAPSGTAGNPITFTAAMKLDASGRLLLGTTSVASAERAIIAFDSAGSVSQGLSTKDTNASASGNSHIILRQSNDVYLGALGRSGTDTAMFVDGNAYLALKTGSTERARLNAGFSVGTTTDPGAGLIADVNGNVRKVPQSGSSKTSSYTLATTDIGEYILLGASGAIVIPDATFAAGDVVSIFNNTASTATITCSITTAYIAGTFTDKATMTLAAAGVATVLFISGTVCVVSGNVT